MALIWQPKGIYQPSFNFEVIFNSDFIQRMKSSQVFPKNAKRMNELCAETLQRFGYNNLTPLNFYKNTGLVTQFSLGREGRWLAIDLYTLDKSLVKYSSHNVDSSKDAYDLMALVDPWTEYSELLIKQ